MTEYKQKLQEWFDKEKTSNKFDYLSYRGVRFQSTQYMTELLAKEIYEFITAPSKPLDTTNL